MLEKILYFYVLFYGGLYLSFYIERYLVIKCSIVQKPEILIYIKSFPEKGVTNKRMLIGACMAI